MCPKKGHTWSLWKWGTRGLEGLKVTSYSGTYYYLFFFFLSRKTVIWTIYCRGIEHKLIIKNVAWISIRTAIQLLSCVQLFVTPWTAPGFPVLHYFSEFAQTHVHWVSDAIQTSHPVFPFSSCLWSFPASGSFPVSQLFTSGGQRIGASTSASFLPMNIQGWFPLDWLVWSCSPRDSQG